MDVYDRCVDEMGFELSDEKGRPIYFHIETGSLGVIVDAPILESQLSPAMNLPVIEENPATEDSNEQVTKSAERFDNVMTSKLIEKVSEKFTLLNDKSHVKKKVWSMIAEEMQKLGYFKEFNTEKGGDKCHQRWRNLEKMYHNHVKYTKSTGKGKKKEPTFFEEMHGVIGERHSSHPVILLDSLPDTKTQLDAQSSDSESISSQPTQESIFKHVKNSVRPKKENVTEVLRELQKEDLNLQAKNFERIERLLLEQNELRKKSVEQRDAFLRLMKDMVNDKMQNKPSRKRKYSEE